MDWATVCIVVIFDVDTRAVHRSCLRHRSIYSTLAGKVCVKCSAAKHMVSFSKCADEEISMFQCMLDNVKACRTDK